MDWTIGTEILRLCCGLHLKQFFFTVHVSPTDHENSFHTLRLKCVNSVAFHRFPCFAIVLHQFDHGVLKMRTLVDLEKVDKFLLRQNIKNAQL